jgi:hypothetical protein
LDTERESRAQVDASVRLSAFGFDDIHPLWGGRSLWVTEDLSAEVWVVDATQRKRRFGLTLTRDVWSEVERVVAESGLWAMTMPARDGLPDEGRPSITLVLASGESVVRAKWANDRSPEFDWVYQHLFALAEGTGG